MRCTFALSYEQTFSNGHLAFLVEIFSMDMSYIPAYLVDKFKHLHCNTSDNFIGVLVKS